MKLKSSRLRHFVVCLSVAGVLPFLENGCSSSTDGSTSATDAGAGTDAELALPEASLMRPPDAASATGDGAQPSQFDGTVGKTCSADVNCQPAGGPGLNVCSIGGLSTPVCVGPTCDPGNDGLIHFCDGPDMTTSPGICVAGSMGGTCLPKCFVPIDGTAPTGCAGTDVCNLMGYAADDKNQLVGAFGFCFGGCVKDSDCPTGTKCQSDLGACTPTVTTPTKAPGSPCTAADNTSGACTCILGTGTSGICSVFCITGNANAACPTGFVCDSGEQSQIDTGDASISGFAIQASGLAGLCLPKCNAGDGGESIAVSDAASDASTDAASDVSSDGASNSPSDAALDAPSDSPASNATDASGGAVTPSVTSCPPNTACVTNSTAGPNCQVL